MTNVVVSTFSPAMNVSYEDQAQASWPGHGDYCEHFRVVTLQEHASAAAELLQGRASEMVRRIPRRF